jgi:hypothetical protein
LRDRDRPRKRAAFTPSSTSSRLHCTHGRLRQPIVQGPPEAEPRANAERVATAEPRAADEPRRKLRRESGGVTDMERPGSWSTHNLHLSIPGLDLSEVAAREEAVAVG